MQTYTAAFNTQEEAESVCKAWHGFHEDGMHDSWERMRMNATIAIQPHIKGKMTPEKMLPFPLEEEQKKGRSTQGVGVRGEEKV